MTGRPPLPPSPWLEASPPAPSLAALDADLQADVAVIGAGFTGLSAALRLAEIGVRAVVLEAVEPGYGASGRNGGQVIAGLKHDPGAIVSTFGADLGERIVAFVGGAPDVVYDLVDRHAIDCGLRRAGWLQCAHGRAVLPTLERRVATWATRGAPVKMLDAAETERRTGARGYAGALFDARGGTLNPLAFARGLADAAIAAGAEIYGHSPAVALERVAGQWHVRTSAGLVRAERVLLATNAYTDGVHPAMRRSIVPVHSYQVATRPLPDDLRDVLLPGGVGLSDTRRLLNYCRQDARGRLVVGGRGGAGESTDAADYTAIVRALARLFPAAADLEVEYRWSGRVALTLDHYPHVGEIAPGLSVALGYNGRGVAMATATGRAMAEQLAGRPLSDLPLPARPIRPLPLHALRAPVLTAAIGLKRLQDWWESRA
ncbi:MAG TPA: FAD-binding oxidoreductase [Thermohalobaculum sp.]|nr:FAD-binding oxidoreductase [Thermohalobaculum sp.]